MVFVGRTIGLDEHEKAIPGKIYDYMAARRPILVVGPNGCAAGKIVENVRRGLCVPDDNEKMLARAIKRLLDPNQRDSLIDLSDEAVQDFEEKTVVPNIVKFFDYVS